MGTLKVDNIQTESGSAIITNGTIPVSTLTNSNVGMVKLVSSTNDGTNPSITLDLTSGTIGSTYKAYKILGHNISSFSASNPNLNMFFGTASDTFSTQIQKGGIRNHTDNAGANDSISYTSYHRSGTTDTGGATVAYYLPNTSDHATFDITVFAINDSSVKARYHGHLNFNSSTNYVHTAIINGRFKTTTITPYVKFQASSGNYAGTVTVYGIVD
tara:strand:- start:50 stop:694 length:645 start_codon:yes stop_codon:yes gene_type:complete